MNKLHLPQWHRPEHVRDILLALPEKKRNRALYELIWQFDHYNPQGVLESEAQLVALRLLWHDPRFQGLENIECWLREVLCLDEDNGAWLALQLEIETLLDTCSTPKPAANTANTAGCSTARLRSNPLSPA